MRQARTVSRDIDAVAIPYGYPMPLKAGTTIFITQSLGGSYTATTDLGYLVRIDGRDADAIGEEVQAGPTEADLASKSLTDLASRSNFRIGRPWMKSIGCSRKPRA